MSNFKLNNYQVEPKINFPKNSWIDPTKVCAKVQVCSTSIRDWIKNLKMGNITSFVALPPPHGFWETFYFAWKFTLTPHAKKFPFFRILFFFSALLASVSHDQYFKLKKNWKVLKLEGPNSSLFYEISYFLFKNHLVP